MKEGSTLAVGIGEVTIARSPCILSAILGSCVGVILYDKKNKVGGLAHVYLPRMRKAIEEEEEKLKYADQLIPPMILKILSQGGERKNISGYIIGGAAVMNKAPTKILNVGEKNLNIVRSILKEKGINFMELEVGGNVGRRVKFDLATGDICIKELNGTGSS